MTDTTPAADAARVSSRRSFLGSAAMIGAALTPSLALTTLAPARAETTFQNGLANIKMLADDHMYAIGDLDEAEVNFFRGRPLRPMALRVPGGGFDTVDYEHAQYDEKDGVRRWFVSDDSIEMLRTAPVPSTSRVYSADGKTFFHYPHAERPQSPEGLAVVEALDRIGLDRAREIVKAYDAWKAEDDAFADRTGLTAAAEIEKEAGAIYISEVTRLMATPVTTGRDFAFKKEVLEFHREFAGTQSDEMSEALDQELFDWVASGRC